LIQIMSDSIQQGEELPIAWNGTVRIPQEVQPAILGANHQIRVSVTIPVYRSRTRIMPCETAAGDRALIHELPGALAGGNILPEVDVFAVEHQVEPAIAVPVGEAELASPTPPRGSGIEP
jgi:hypothetical protein